MKGFAIGVAATAIALVLLAFLLPQVEYGGDIVGLVLLAIVFGVVNGFIKPIVKLFSLPITAMTLGLFSVVINAALLLFGTWVAYELFGIAFTISGFPTNGLSLEVLVSALIAAIVLSIISTVVGLVVHD
ncbi:MAG TPA: phage holin family protein [Candidatus Limnocylindrales bacterium]|nr:phage holin family protein [Candidatus Limnocylindrales bacterium]